MKEGIAPEVFLLWTSGTVIAEKIPEHTILIV